MKVVAASANPDKVAEIATILEACGIDLVARPPGIAEVEESAETLEGNARLKAVAVCEAAGAAAVADDTGLEVDALDGRPGVRSARYAGEDATYEDNVALLLEELDRAEARAAGQRTARFRTIALLRWTDGSEVVCHGTVEGHIAPAPRGTAGFGYDSVFVPDAGDGRTFAEMTAEEKHALSHRGEAFRALASSLER